MNDGVDLDRSQSDLHRAGLIPPVIGLQVMDENGCEIVLVEVLAPLDVDVTSRIADVLGSTPHKIQEVTITAEGRRPGVIYGAAERR